MKISQVRIGGKVLEITEEEKELLRLTASNDREEALRHQRALAQVISGAWRAGVLESDIISMLFDRIVLEPGSDAKFPFDFYSPTDEEASQFKAFVVPKEGSIPDRVVDGDQIYVPTYKIANAISWSLDYARDARWDVVARAIEVYSNGFTQKLNDDGWHVVLTAAASNAVTTDSAAAAGVFTVNLLTKMMSDIKRLTGGRGSRLTDLFLSPEAMGDIRSLSAFQIADRVDQDFGYMKGPDDATMRELLMLADGSTPTLFGVRMHELHELGDPGGTNAEYQAFLETDLSVSIGSDEEFVVGLDLENRDSFVMPVREDMSMFEDPTLHRAARAGVYGWMEQGFAALDTRRAILGSL